MGDHDLSIDPPQAPQVGGAGPVGEDPLELWPEGAPEAPAAAFDDPFDDQPLVQATEDQVRTVLEFLGELGNAAADPDVPDQWLFTDRELDQLVPPLTRIINRHQWLARMVAGNDPLLAGVVLTKYLRRNVVDGLDARRNREESNDAVIDAEARGAGPEPDRPGHAGADQWDGEPWSAGVPADEVAGLGAFQG